MKAAYIMLALLIASTLALQPASAEKTLWIETIPLSPQYRRLPVKVYWRPSETCPPEFNEPLKKTLDAAIALLRKSVWRLMEENDGKFDEMISFRIEYTSDPREAKITVTGGELSPGVAGETAFKVTGKGVAEAEITLDCDVVLKPVVPAFNVVLHELLHALGLGHTNFYEVNGEGEVMYGGKPPGEPTIYASTLDLYALYELWYRNYRGRRITMPAELGFREVRPYVVELEELKKIYQALHEKYGVLEDEVSGLKQNLTSLGENLTNVTSRVGAVEGRINTLNASVGLLSKGLSSVRGEVEGVRAEVGDVKLMVRAVSQTMASEIAKLNSSLTSEAAAVESLAKEVSELRLEVAELRSVNAQLLQGVIAAFLALAACIVFLAYLASRRGAPSREPQSRPG